MIHNRLLGVALAGLLLLGGVIVLRYSAGSQADLRMSVAPSRGGTPTQTTQIPVGNILPAPSGRGEPRGRLDEAEIRNRIVPGLLAAFSERVRSQPPGQLNRFTRDMYLGLREARLLAQAFPELMEKLASEIALDSARSPMERFYMLYVLGDLAQAGQLRATDCLVRVANTADAATASRAILTLYPADPQGAQRLLYMTKAGEGDEVAFDALSFFPDDATQAFIRRLRESPQGGTSESFTLHLAAEELTGRYQLLNSPDWSSKLAETILKADNPKEVLWALSASRVRSLPNLADVLRRRLDESMKKIEAEFAGAPPGPSTASGRAPSFEEMYTADPSLRTSRLKAYYDDLLVAQQQLGGRLTELEKARLRTFGYGCDPKVRLQELLAEGDK